MWHKHLLRNYKWHFRLPMSAFATTVWNTLSKHQLFTLNFAFKLFRVFNVIDNCRSQKYHLQFLNNYVYHKLAKFDQKTDDPNYTKFWAFLQKAVSHVKHSDISLVPFWKRFLQVKQFHDAKIFKTWLPSFVIPKITVVWHMKPE